MTASPTPRHPGARTVSTVAIVTGALCALGMVLTAAVGTSASAVDTAGSPTPAVAVDGVTRLDVDVSRGLLQVRFADVPRAQLTVTEGKDTARWSLDRHAGVLRVRTPHAGIVIWPWLGPDNGRAVLELPENMAGVDASLDLAAGALDVAGRFGALSVDVSGGRAAVDGEADTLKLDLSGGQAVTALGDVRRADVTVAAGEGRTTFTGTPPQALTLSATAGALWVTVPRADYDVSTVFAGGSFDNRIGSVPGAPHTVYVEATAGSVVLSPAP